jgi:aspartate-semialdehyde dehydrogenase
MAKTVNVAVVGATGLVGRKMIQVLEERNFPVADIGFFATARSVGKELAFKEKSHQVWEAKPEAFEGYDLALFSAGATVSKGLAPEAVKRRALVIDNSSAFRLDDDVPLVVPEVNKDEIFKHRGIIANPNCSTIQLVIVLKPLHDRFRIKRVIVSTYQSVTGAGKRAVDQLNNEILGRPVAEKKFPHTIAYNCLPQVDVFYEDGYTREEHKVMKETRKIMGDDSLQITATCVRVPVFGGHSESVNIEFEEKFDLEEVRGLLSCSPGIVVQDDPERNFYPMPINSHERDEVFVGRIRRDETVRYGLNLWIVSDNLRKGAATNAVQIAEAWLEKA